MNNTVTNKTIPLFGAVCVSTGKYLAPQLVTKKEKYTCPICNDLVVLAEGPVRRRYIRHQYKRSKECTVYTEPSVTAINTINTKYSRDDTELKLVRYPVQVRLLCKHRRSCLSDNTIPDRPNHLLQEVTLSKEDFVREGDTIISDKLFSGIGNICYNTPVQFEYIEVTTECPCCCENRALFEQTVQDQEYITQCPGVLPTDLPKFKFWTINNVGYCIAFEKKHFDKIEGVYRADLLPLVDKLKPKGTLKIDLNIDRRHYDPTETSVERATSYVYDPVLLENATVILVKDLNYYSNDWVRLVIRNRTIMPSIRHQNGMPYKKPVVCSIPTPVPLEALSPVGIVAPKKILTPEGSVSRPTPNITALPPRPYLEWATNWKQVDISLPFRLKNQAKQIFNVDGFYNLFFNGDTKIWSVNIGNKVHFDVINIRVLTVEEYEKVKTIVLEPYNTKGYTTVRLKLLPFVTTTKITDRDSRFVLLIDNPLYYTDDFIYTLL
jgi:hypothetical protein